MPAPVPPDVITLEIVRETLYVAVVADVLDTLGFRRQACPGSLVPLTVAGLLAGRCKTTLWVDMYHEDPRPYELELRAVDEVGPEEVLIAAAGGSMRSGIWGELLSTAARNRGCAGAIVDGAVRDVAAMQSMQFPVFARGRCPYDSKNRQRVVDLDIPVEIDGVSVHPGEIVLADADGLVVIPRKVEQDALRMAWEKVHAENEVRAAIRQGMLAREAFDRYQVL
jgi:4-hydroxy-4-methyl-2-oxoglutarate aldolase